MRILMITVCLKYFSKKNVVYYMAASNWHWEFLLPDNLSVILLDLPNQNVFWRCHEGFFLNVLGFFFINHALPYSYCLPISLECFRKLSSYAYYTLLSLLRLSETKRILAHLSWKLKWAFLIACHWSSVCPFIRLFANFSLFQLFLLNNWADFNQIWHKATLVKSDSSLFKWRVTPFFKGR